MATGNNARDANAEELEDIWSMSSQRLFDIQSDLHEDFQKLTERLLEMRQEKQKTQDTLSTLDRLRGVGESSKMSVSIGPNIFVEAVKTDDNFMVNAPSGRITTMTFTQTKEYFERKLVAISKHISLLEFQVDKTVHSRTSRSLPPECYESLTCNNNENWGHDEGKASV